MNTIMETVRLRHILVMSLFAVLMAGGLLWATKVLETKWLVASLAALTLLLVAVASGQLEKFLLGFFFVMIPMNADINWHPVDVSSGIQELGISSLNIILFGLYFLWLVRIVLDRNSTKIIWPSGATVLLLFIGWSALSILNAREPLFSIFSIVGFLKAFLCFFYIANHIKTRDSLWFAVRCMMVGLIAESLIACAEYVKGGNLGLYALGERKIEKEMALSGSKVFRVGGTLGHPNYLGGYLASVLPLALILNLTSLRPLQRLLVTIAIILGSGVLVLTFSRSAWLATAVTVTGLFGWLVARGYIRLRPLPVLIAAVSLGLILVFFGPAIKARWVEDDRGSTTSRFAQARVAGSMIAAHPTLGVGLNNYDAVKQLYETDVYSRLRTSTVNRVHNVFLLVASETGIPSFILFISFLGVVFRRGWVRLSETYDERIRLILVGVFFSLLARLGHDALHTSFLSDNVLLWTYSGFLAAKRSPGEND